MIKSEYVLYSPSIDVIFLLSYYGFVEGWVAVSDGYRRRPSELPADTIEVGQL